MAEAEAVHDAEPADVMRPYLQSFATSNDFEADEVVDKFRRIDLLIRTSDYIYIIECKLDASAKIALHQIERKDYPLPWSADKRTIFLIGLNFSSKTRRLEEWEIGQKVVKEIGQRNRSENRSKS